MVSQQQQTRTHQRCRMERGGGRRSRETHLSHAHLFSLNLRRWSTRSAFLPHFTSKNPLQSSLRKSLESTFLAVE